MRPASGREPTGKAAVALARAALVPARMSSVSAVVSWTLAPTGIEPAKLTDPETGSDPWMARRYDSSPPASTTARGFPNDAGPVTSR